MMRICAIGNSHLAALVLGWKKIGNEYPGIEFTFFGAPGLMMEDLAVSNGSLTPKTSELKRYFKMTVEKAKISPEYNYYFICGSLFSLALARKLSREYRAEAFAKDSRIPISDACFLRSLQASLCGTMAVKLVEKVRQISSAPVVLIPAPVGSENPSRSRPSGGNESDSEPMTVAALFKMACSQLERELDVQIISQPESTKSSPFKTKALYSRGSIGFRGGLVTEHLDKDMRHMNAEFGAIVLGDALARLAGENRSLGTIPDIASLHNGQKHFGQAL